MAQDCCYFVNGKVYALDSNSVGSWSYNWDFSWDKSFQEKPVGRYLGNVENLNITVEKTFNTVVRNENYLKTPDCANVTINNVSLQITLRCANVANFLMGFYGSEKNVSAPIAVVQEPVFNTTNGFKKGSLIPFNQIGVNKASVVLQNSVTLSNYVLNIDYIVTDFGVELLNDFNFPMGEFFKISYSYSSGVQRIEALTKTSKITSLMFAGINAMDGTPVVVKIYKVLLSPISNFEVISKDFASFTMDGIVLADDTITASDESKYFTTEKIQS